MFFNQYHILDEILLSFSTDNYMNGNNLWISILDIGIKVAERNGNKYAGIHVLSGALMLAKNGYLQLHLLDVKDNSGNLIYDNNGNKQVDHAFSLTFDGYLLIKDGGYRSKMINEASGSILNWALTISIAIGTAVAGIYSLTQLYDWFYIHGCQFWFAK